MTIEILTAILVLITAVYVFLTYRIAKASEASVEAMRDQSEAMLRPYVTITPFIRPNTSFFYLRVKNTGRMGAQNLRLTLDRDFFKCGEKDRPDENLRTKSAFKTPIDNFPPRAELVFLLAQSFVLFGDDANSDICPVQFNVTASYQFFEKKVEEVNQIDLRPYLGSAEKRNPIAEELKQIRKAIERR